MKIINIRRASQTFFLILFFWFCIVSTVGERWWQIRGWPVDWFLQLDPLVALGTIMTTHSLYWPLLWALLTIVLTIILGRFFCGWLCPFGTMHHGIGYLAHRKKKTKERISLNKYRKAQSIKYYILAILVTITLFAPSPASLQTGLVDPIPLVTRSMNLIILPLADTFFKVTSATARHYEGAWLIFLIFFAALLLNIIIPRFYCRFICPLGALFGIMGRFSIFRIGKKGIPCNNDHVCERDCAGACEPSESIRVHECVLCLNCRHDCHSNVIEYQTTPSVDGENLKYDISRRAFLLSIGISAVTLPAARLGDTLGNNWNHKLIRPPGALEEGEFLKRCIKCGQCIRICPSNVLQLAGTEGGIEALWTPVMNNRIGTSGCQYNCTACGQICPTSAIRPVSLDEKHGQRKFSDSGPLRIGTAFVDRSRCLPWAMQRPCIVCQENCPISPKAIYTDEHFSEIRNGTTTVIRIYQNTITLAKAAYRSGSLGTGDYFCQARHGTRLPIADNGTDTIAIAPHMVLDKISPGSIIRILVKLQRPFIDIDKCNGCGICEHECPVSGKRAVRISAEGESRSTRRALLIKR